MFRGDDDDIITESQDICINLRWMIPPMVVHPEKIDFHRFV